MKLEEAMKSLDRHVFVRFDPDRKEKNFTVMVEGVRRRDTDNPLGYLGRWTRECHGKPVIMMCRCGLNWSCSVCSFGGGQAPCECREPAPDQEPISVVANEGLESKDR